MTSNKDQQSDTAIGSSAAAEAGELLEAVETQTFALLKREVHKNSPQWYEKKGLHRINRM